MNFTQTIKRELIKKLPEKECCGRALLAGALAIGTGAVSFISESEEIAAYLLGLFEQLYSAELTVSEAVRDPKHGRNKLTFTYEGALALPTADELPPCCAAAYLKGAFLCGGSCTLPGAGKKTGYHFEIVFCERERAEAFVELLDRVQLFGNVVQRGDRFVVYSKNRESISDFLSVMGAEGALVALGEVSARREENNMENRVSNCLAGNADRSAIASVEQVRMLSSLKEKGGLEGLDRSLRELAEARLNNPTLSLSELAGILGLSKSGVSHRMRKLAAISKAYR